MAAPQHVEKGLPVEVTLAVENHGTKDASHYAVRLAVADEVLYSETFDTPLASLATHTIPARVVLPVSMEGSELTLTATVSYEADEDCANNTALQQMTVGESPVPAPNQVSGSQQGRRCHDLLGCACCRQHPDQGDLR